jgi:lipopolysaccharide transport system permease protein
LWIIVNPLIQVLIYSCIFSRLGAKIPEVDFKYAYMVYILSGFLAWNLFIDITNRCLTLYIQHANLIKKMNFPRITLPIIAAGTALINNMLLLVSVVLLFLILGHKLSINILWLLPCFFSLCAFSLGLGLILGVINVFLRDVAHVMPFILQFWYWITPIVYHKSIIPESYRMWLNLNPLYPIITAYQDIIVYGHRPNMISLIGINVFILLLVLFSCFIFRRASEEMVDVL